MGKIKQKIEICKRIIEENIIFKLIKKTQQNLIYIIIILL